MVDNVDKYLLVRIGNIELKHIKIIIMSMIKNLIFRCQQLDNIKAVKSQITASLVYIGMAFLLEEAGLSANGVTGADGIVVG